VFGLRGKRSGFRGEVRWCMVQSGVGVMSYGYTISRRFFSDSTPGLRDSDLGFGAESSGLRVEVSEVRVYRSPRRRRPRTMPPCREGSPFRVARLLCGALDSEFRDQGSELKSWVSRFIVQGLKDRVQGVLYPAISPALSPLPFSLSSSADDCLRTEI